MDLPEETLCVKDMSVKWSPKKGRRGKGSYDICLGRGGEKSSFGRSRVLRSLEKSKKGNLYGGLFGGEGVGQGIESALR